MAEARLSIIIPTHNRPELLRTLLKRLKAQGINDMDLYVLDSSRPEIQEQNASAVKSLGDGWRYSGFDQDNLMLPKVQEALKRISTPYTVICADDDLINIAAVRKCMDFLDSHEDYAACHGRYVLLEENKGDKSITRIEYAGQSFESEDAYERILDIFMDYEATSFAVVRTQVQKSLVYHSILPEIIMFKELSMALVLSLHGKIKRTQDIYGFRAPADPSATRALWEPTPALAADPDAFVRGFADLRERLVLHAKTLDGKGLGEDDLRAALNFGFLSYLYFNVNLKEVARLTLPGHIWDKIPSRFNQRKPNTYLPIKQRFLRDRLFTGIRPFVPNIVVTLLKPIPVSRGIVGAGEWICRIINKFRTDKSESYVAIGDVRVVANVASSMSETDMEAIRRALSEGQVHNG